MFLPFPTPKTLGLFWCSLAAHSSMQSSGTFFLSPLLFWQNTLILCFIPLMFCYNRKPDLFIYGQVLAVDNDTARRYKVPCSQTVLSDFNFERHGVFNIILHRQLLTCTQKRIFMSDYYLMLHFCVSEVEISSGKF